MGGLLATISIGIDPMIEIGPVSLAWHGLFIAIGILTGGVVAGYYGQNRGLDTAPFYTIGIILVVGSLIGAKLFFLLEHGQLLEPSEWFNSQGFTFYGGFIAAALGIGIYVWRERLPVGYMDAVAFGLPLGIAIGRLGDVINGEHFGPATDFFLGVQNTHPDALVPSPDLAYHSGGLYEVMLGAIVFLIVLTFRSRLQRPWAMSWTVLSLIAIGRFIEFFVRSDSDTLALGLEIAQWTSVLIVAICAVGAWLTLGSGREWLRQRRATA